VLDGVTASETSVAPLTFSGAEPEMPPRVALMLAVPAPTPSAVPTVLTVATLAASEDQTASVVITCVEPSLKVAVAVKVSLLFGAIVCPNGVTVIVETVALVTVRIAVCVLEPMVAVTVVEPTVKPLATPLLELIVATAVLEDVHPTWFVKLCVLPSLKVPIAVNL